MDVHELSEGAKVSERDCSTMDVHELSEGAGVGEVGCSVATFGGMPVEIVEAVVAWRLWLSWRDVCSDGVRYGSDGGVRDGQGQVTGHLLFEKLVRRRALGLFGAVYGLRLVSRKFFDGVEGSFRRVWSGSGDGRDVFGLVRRLLEQSELCGPHAWLSHGVVGQCVHVPFAAPRLVCSAYLSSCVRVVGGVCEFNGVDFSRAGTSLDFGVQAERLTFLKCRFAGGVVRVTKNGGSLVFRNVVANVPATELYVDGVDKVLFTGPWQPGVTIAAGQRAVSVVRDCRMMCRFEYDFFERQEDVYLPPFERGGRYVVAHSMCAVYVYITSATGRAYTEIELQAPVRSVRAKVVDSFEEYVPLTPQVVTGDHVIRHTLLDNGGRNAANVRAYFRDLFASSRQVSIVPHTHAPIAYDVCGPVITVSFSGGMSVAGAGDVRDHVPGMSSPSPDDRVEHFLRTTFMLDSAHPTSQHAFTVTMQNHDISRAFIRTFRERYPNATVTRIQHRAFHMLNHLIRAFAAENTAMGPQT
jgi:hypothetical protein